MGRTRGSKFGITVHMSPTKRTILANAALILGGVALSTLLVSTDGNSQNPLSVIAEMGLVVLVVGIVSFALALFVRTVPLAVLGSAAITEMLFLLYFVCRVAFSEHLHAHVSEELYLLPIVFGVGTAPTVVLSSIGLGRLASRVYRTRRAEPSASPKCSRCGAEKESK